MLYIGLLANAPNQAESLLRGQGQAEGGIGLQVNADKTRCICFNQEGDISTLNGGLLKLVNKSRTLVPAFHQLKVTSICT